MAVSYVHRVPMHRYHGTSMTLLHEFLLDSDGGLIPNFKSKLQEHTNRGEEEDA